MFKFLDRLLILSTNDLQFNFLIGGDGKIYEGLSTVCPVGKFGPKSIVVTLIGDSTKESSRINTRQYEALELLIDAGVAIGDIVAQYQLAPMCCAVAARGCEVR